MDDRTKTIIDWVLTGGLATAAGITWRYGGKILKAYKAIDQLFLDTKENKVTVAWHTKQFRAIFRAFGIPSDLSNPREIEARLEAKVKKLEIDRLAAIQELASPASVDTPDQTQWYERQSAPWLEQPVAPVERPSAPRVPRPQSEPRITRAPSLPPPPLAAQRRLSTGGHTAWRGKPQGDSEAPQASGVDDTGGHTAIGMPPHPEHKPRKK